MISYGGGDRVIFKCGGRVLAPVEMEEPTVEPTLVESAVPDPVVEAETPAAMADATVEASKFRGKNTRTGGSYIPPQRAALMKQDLPEEGSEAYQRLSWEALRKSINGLINKINTSNIKEIIVELFGENLVRGRGLLVRSVMKAQAQALPFTGIYAAMMAVLNTKLPMIGELLLTRLIHQFRRAYRRNDKAQCLAVTMFLAHLVNQRVAHEIVALQVLTLLLERPTDDSAEIAVGFMRECGAALAEMSPKPSNAIFERFRVILHEGLIDKRVQYMIEVLFQLRKDNFVGHEAIPVSLDLVSEEDQITHYISLDDELDPQDGLNIFKFDEEFLEKEKKYAQIKEEILGETDDEAEEEEEEVAPAVENKTVSIRDETSTDLINLRKTIYLTVMSSVDFEECGHKLLKLNIPEGLEIELCNMIVECCSQERTYLKFFGLLSERFCELDSVWREAFEACFDQVYSTVHRLETNRIRNICRLFGHLLYTDAISWGVFASIRLTEEDTTSASRIFIKFLFQELSELYGIPKLNARLSDPGMLRDYFGDLFPKDSPRNTRFAINFFTAIGLGGLTEGLREHLATVQAVQDEEPRYIEPQSYIGSPLSDTSDDSYASSPSRSPSRSPSPRRHRERSPDRRYDGRHRDRSLERSPGRRARTPPRHRERSMDRSGRRERSRTPPRYRRRSPSRSRSRTRSRRRHDSRSPRRSHR